MTPAPPWTLTTDGIAEKFIQDYWRQAVPYVTGSQGRVFQQNTDRQAKVVNIVRAARGRHGDSLAAVMKEAKIWQQLRRQASKVVRDQPLWKLQTVSRERLDFLYENTVHRPDQNPGALSC